MKLIESLSTAMTKPGNVVLTERAGDMVPMPAIRSWTFEIADYDIALFNLDERNLEMLARIRAEVTNDLSATPVAARLLELAFHARMVELSRGPGTIFEPKAGKLIERSKGRIESPSSRMVAYGGATGGGMADATLGLPKPND